MDGKGGYDGKNCRCPHHSVMPLLVVLLGVVFLLQALGTVSIGFVNVAWPILVILAGFQKFFNRRCKCCNCKHV